MCTRVCVCVCFFFCNEKSKATPATCRTSYVNGPPADSDGWNGRQLLYTYYIYILIYTCIFVFVVSGLLEGAIVSCKQVDEVPTISTVQVMASNQKDWEMLVCSSAITRDGPIAGPPDGRPAGWPSVGV